VNYDPTIVVVVKDSDPRRSTGPRQSRWPRLSLQFRVEAPKDVQCRVQVPVLQRTARRFALAGTAAHCAVESDHQFVIYVSLSPHVSCTTIAVVTHARGVVLVDQPRVPHSRTLLEALFGDPT
jgi:hypothetical protein